MFGYDDYDEYLEMFYDEDGEAYRHIDFLDDDFIYRLFPNKVKKDIIRKSTKKIYKEYLNGTLELEDEEDEDKDDGFGIEGVLRPYIRTEVSDRALKLLDSDDIKKALFKEAFHYYVDNKSWKANKPSSMFRTSSHYIDNMSFLLRYLIEMYLPNGRHSSDLSENTIILVATGTLDILKNDSLKDFKSFEKKFRVCVNALLESDYSDELNKKDEFCFDDVFCFEDDRDESILW